MIRLFACMLLPLIGFAQNPDIAEVIRKHVEKKGGVYALNRLKSIRMEGTHFQNGEESKFILHKKRPNLIRYSLSNDSLSALFGYDGSNGWMRKQVGAEPAVIIDIDGPALSALLEEARFESPLTELNNDGDNQMVLLKQESVKGRMHNVVEWTHDDVLKGRYYIDAETFLVSKRELVDADKAVELVTVYEDYSKVDNFSIAFTVSNEIEGRLLNVQKIENVQINPGVLSIYFEKPTN
jgi:hypothetical protein